MKIVQSLFLIAAMFIMLTACDSKDKADRSKGLTPNVEQNKSETVTKTPEVNIQPQESTAPVGASPVAINPPHGQPGHDCKIPVGAPLNSAPQQTSPNTTTTTTMPQIQATPSTQSTTVTPPGMNPPHGQPGHDCKIPVGAPLNSGSK